MPARPSLKHDSGRDPFAGSTFMLEDETDDVMASIVRAAAALLAEGEFAEAEKYLSQGLAREPKHPKLLAYLAISVAARGERLDTATKIARTVVRDNPEDPAGHFALGKVNLLDSRRGAAFRHFGRAMELGRHDTSLQQELQRVEPRRSPVFGSLRRNHFLNIYAGRLRATLLRMLGRA